MKKDYCHITAIIDRSGSMGGLEKEVIGGFNNFIKDQREIPGECTITLIQFDNEYEVNYEFSDINEVHDLNSDTYVPRGMTAMYDAIGKAITSTGKKLSEMDENDRPEKVIIFIQTDGMENASQEYGAQTIKDMIKEQEDKYSWEFVFLGANIDAKSVGTTIGISANNSMTYAATVKGTSCALKSVSENIVDYRLGKKTNMSYEDKDYKRQENSVRC
jgi:uncharacterized protein YegL